MTNKKITLVRNCILVLVLIKYQIFYQTSCKKHQWSDYMFIVKRSY